MNVIYIEHKDLFIAEVQGVLTPDVVKKIKSNFSNVNLTNVLIINGSFTHIRGDD